VARGAGRDRVQPCWAALLKRPAALAAALGLALLSFGLVVWLEPRPRQTLRQLRSTLRALRHNPLLRPWADQRQWWPAALAALGVLLVVVLQRAWITDDAFLTLRTVENYIGGHGLTWNPGERVQIFTHPLWALLLVAAVALLGSYAGVMVLSVLSTAAAAAVVVLRLAATPYSALLAAALLVLSNAFVSFSTSGLENPLTHLLLVLFVLLYLHRPRTRGGLLLLLLLAGLALFCRLDTALLYLPALVVALWQHRQELRLGLLSQLRLGAMALAPLFSWLLFSLFYYGSALPNTARAKLATGIPRADLLAQGGVYLADSLARDPVTLAVIGSSALVPLITGQRRLWPLLAGAWLYLAYTVWIGGCFMSGRFLTAPLLLAVVVWARLPLADLRQAAAPTVAFGVLGLLLRPFPYDSPGFRQPESGVVDERLHYQAKWGLVFLHRSKPPPAVGWSNPYEDGKPFTCGQAGVRGYTLGASQHLVDVCALGDPLLARLPAEGALGGSWRIGHYMRILPGGYVQSAVHDQNLLRSPGLFRFYAGLRHVVRGDLFDPARLARIARLPGSRLPDLSHLFRTRRLTPEQLARQGPRDGRPHGGIVLGYSGVLVSLGERRLDPRVEVALGQGCGYLLFFLREGRPLGTVKIHTGGERGMVVKRLGIPRRAQKEGYDSIRVVPFGGAGEHAIFHLRPL
jgi:arabinofuranosyltransferase